MNFQRTPNDYSVGVINSEVLAVNLDEGRVLLKAKWQIGSKDTPIDMENICFVSTGYFEEKYGSKAQAFMQKIRSEVHG